MHVVEAKSASEIKALRDGAFADPARFAVWPIGLQVPWFHAEWYALTQKYLIDPSYKNLIILAATGFGKSTALSLNLPLYEIVKNRSIQMGIIGSNQKNAWKIHSGIARQLTENRDLISAYGWRGEDGVARFKPKKPEKWTLDEMLVEGASTAAAQQGRVLSDPTISVFGWKSAMEGRHFDLLLGDDVVDYREAQSPIIREQQIEWFENILKNRMNPNGRMIFIGTRAHHGDLYQYLIDTKEFVVIDYPQALVTTPEGEEVSAWPERFPTERLKEMRARNPVSFALKQMNQISGDGMSEFSKELIEAAKDPSLAYYGNPVNLPQTLKDQNLVIYEAVDLATGLTLEAKYFVILVYGVNRRTGDRYLLDILRVKLRVGDQRAKVKEKHYIWGASEIVIENNSTQSYFYEDVMSGLPIKPVYTGTNKASIDEGLPSLVALLRAKKLHIPWAGAHAQAVSMPFITELQEHPTGVTSDILMAWWFAERAARKLFYQPPPPNPRRNFFVRSRRVFGTQRFGQKQYHRVSTGVQH